MAYGLSKWRNFFITQVMNGLKRSCLLPIDKGLIILTSGTHVIQVISKNIVTVPIL
jgi:restriction endonuclease S subunit